MGMILCSLIFTVATARSEEEKEQATAEKNRIYFSLGDESQTPRRTAQEQFSCNEKVFAVIELNQFEAGVHELEVKWTDPHGDERENTRYQFQSMRDTTRLWAWIVLSRAPGSAIFRWLDPSIGLEEFVGIWQVEVKIDQKHLSSANFEVVC